METDSPPPYAAHNDHSGAARFCDEIQSTIHREVFDCRFDRETERLATFLRYVLRRDYDQGPRVHLYAEHRDHFAAMHKHLREMKFKQYDESQKATLQAYLWKYLRQPCKRLGIPYDYVVKIVQHFFESLDADGKYKGPVHDLMVNSGLSDVAMKIYLDETIIVPAVFAFESDRRTSEMLKGLRDMSNRWFVKIHGIDDEIRFSGPTQRPWVGAHSIKFELNRAGLEAEIARRRLHEMVALRKS